MWSSKITFRKNRQGFHSKYNNDFSSKFGDGDRPNLCRLKKVDVSSTFIEIYFSLGWPSSVLEIVSVAKIKNKRLVQSEPGTLGLWISRSMLEVDVDLLLICRLTEDLYSISCMVIILIITRQELKEAFTNEGIAGMKRLCINPLIKSAHSGYQDHVIRIMGI